MVRVGRLLVLHGATHGVDACVLPSHTLDPLFGLALCTRSSVALVCAGHSTLHTKLFVLCLVQWCCNWLPATHPARPCFCGVCGVCEQGTGPVLHQKWQLLPVLSCHVKTGSSHTAHDFNACGHGPNTAAIFMCHQGPGPAWQCVRAQRSWGGVVWCGVV